MMRKTIQAGLFTALLVLAGAAARADDAAYDIKLLRTTKIGDKFAVSMTVDEDRTAKVEVNGAEVQNKKEATKYTLDGAIEITAVDEESRESGFHVVINKLQAAENGEAAKDVLAKGAKVDVAYKDRKAEFTSPDGDLSEAAQKALAACFEPHQSKKTDDDMFGTEGKKKVGAEWKVNSKAMAEDAAGSPMQVDADKITGTMKLVGKKDFAGIPALEISGAIEVTDFAMGDLGKSKDGKMNVAMTALVPTDPANPSTTLTLDMKLHGVFELEKGDAKATITMDANIKRHETMVAQ